MQAIKNIVKYIIALLLYYSGLLALYVWLDRNLGGRPGYVILMYHRVLDDIDAANIHTQPGMSVSSEAFDSQLSFLRRKYRVLSLNEFVRALDGEKKTSRPVAIVTFDDGWRDNYTVAFPILRRHNVPASIFLTTDYVGTNRPFWFLTMKWILTDGGLTPDSLTGIIADIAEAVPSQSEVLAELVHVIKAFGLDADRIIEACKGLEAGTLDKLIDAMLVKSKLSLQHWETEKPMMSWEQAREMSRQGIDIASHGCSHRILTMLPAADITGELTGSKTVIEAELGTKVNSFAYPNGNYDDEVRSAVENAGYSCALTTSGAKPVAEEPDRFALRRVAIHDGVSAGPTGRFSEAMFAWHLVRHA